MAVSDFLLDQPCFMHVIWCNLSQILFRENLMANKQHSQTYIPCHRTLSFPSALPASLRLRFSGLQGTLNCQLRSVWSPGYYSSVSEIGHSACLDTSWCKLVAKEGVSSWFLFVFFFSQDLPLSLSLGQSQHVPPVSILWVKQMAKQSHWPPLSDNLPKIAWLLKTPLRGRAYY